MQKRLQKGFTLLEILISVGILVIVTTLIAQILFTTLHINTRTSALADVKQNGTFAVDVVNRMVRAANSIQTTCNMGVSSATSVQITTANNDVITILCTSDGSAARIASVSASGVQYLTSGNVTLSTSGGVTCNDSSLAFSCPPADGVQSAVDMSFMLGKVGMGASTPESGTTSFQSTVSVRN
jgi:prepilin-type N-terminal cleavage/methylation domain-containing protein